MNPTADQVARVIIAAARETGADPLAIARGDKDPPEDRAPNAPHKTSRARGYAAMALLRTFDLRRDEAARVVGVAKHSWNGYFGPLAYNERRGSNGNGWWSPEAFVRVLAVAEAIGAPEEPGPTEEPAEVPERAQEPPARPEPPPYKPPLPKPIAKPAELGTMDGRGGYRPPADAIKRVLADDTEDGPVFDRGLDVGRKPRVDLGPKPKQSIRDMLAEAVRNTANLPTGSGGERE